ncbi:hypothetical protein A7982_13182 [Minicystis rosea]|nr:hypothetical protein A7982_13182 [Minicystis rosea]
MVRCARDHVCRACAEQPCSERSSCSPLAIHEQAGEIANLVSEMSLEA